MHLSMDKFVMADFDVETGQELEVRILTDNFIIPLVTLLYLINQTLIESEHGKWFLGGEPFVWNMAIERRLP